MLSNFADIELKKLRLVSETLKDTANYDFTNYALSSFKRRIARILELYKFNSIEELTQKLNKDRVFTEQVVQEITVNTTEMFRDPGFWRKLRDEVFPSFNKNHNIRIWHAACSSGEEVYSMAILLREMDLLNQCSIYATDLNEEVLQKAKNGIYNLRNMEIARANYERFNPYADLAKYYTLEKDDKIKFDSTLIKQVIFRKHDLVQNPSFSKFDLILCRNVMIYFNMTLQEQVLKLFDESLFTKSYLAIGSKESIAWTQSSKNFKTLSAEEKIYQKNN